MRIRLVVSLVAVTLLVASCNAGSDTEGTSGGSGPTGSAPTATGATATGASGETGPAPTVVTSDDGLLTVSVPAPEADRVDVEIQQTVEPPPELRSVRISGAFYELEPDGATFEEPVTITKTIDLADTSVDLDEGAPVVLLLSRSSDGTWEALDDQHEVVRDGTVVVSGTTTHFSTVLALGGAATLSFVPRRVRARVGATWGATVSMRTASPNVDLHVGSALAEEAVSTRASGDGADVPAPPPPSGFPQSGTRAFECAREGAGSFGIAVRIDSFDLGDVLQQLGGVKATDVDVELWGNATCLGADQTGDYAIEGGAVCVTHAEFEDYPSELDWFVEFAGDAADGATVTLVVEGGNDGQPVEATVDQQGSATLQMGISEFGPKPIQEATLTPAGGGPTIDLVEDFRDTFGDAPEVTGSEGRIAGTGDCPVM